MGNYHKTSTVISMYPACRIIRIAGYQERKNTPGTSPPALKKIMHYKRYKKFKIGWFFYWRGIVAMLLIIAGRGMDLRMNLSGTPMNSFPA